jgi:peptidoglycan/xylan/chitin deacetylase (PgdA/CDA1 family)
MIYKILNFLHIPALLRWVRTSSQTVGVLSLHRISPEIDPFWQPIHPHTFEKMLQYASKAYRVVGFAELQDALKTKGKPILVFSFDDGYLDFMEFALPLLQKYKILANHNLVIDCLDTGERIWTQRLNQLLNFWFEKQSFIELVFNQPAIPSQLFRIDKNAQDWYQAYMQLLLFLLKTPRIARLGQIQDWEKGLDMPENTVRMMRWEDAKACLDSGWVEIGSHTHTHEPLPTLSSEEDLHKEITVSKQRLETALGTSINILAAPNGQSSPSIRHLATGAGYDFLLEVGDLFYTPQSSEKMQIVPRINLIEEPETAWKLRMERFQARIKGR